MVCSSLGLVGVSDIFWVVGPRLKASIAFFVGQVSFAWCSSAVAYL